MFRKLAYKHDSQVKQMRRFKTRNQVKLKRRNRGQKSAIQGRRVKQEKA